VLYRNVCILYRNVYILYIQYPYTSQVLVATSGIVTMWDEVVKPLTPKKYSVLSGKFVFNMHDFSGTLLWCKTRPACKHKCPNIVTSITEFPYSWKREWRLFSHASDFVLKIWKSVVCSVYLSMCKGFMMACCTAVTAITIPLFWDLTPHILVCGHQC